jgi:LuxR family transcriptional regulator, maltose regulon positive regulatory protein
MHLAEADRSCVSERENAAPVATTKVSVPATAPTVLVRERLHVMLDAAVAQADVGPPVTVLCAPAGTGKTTLLAAWARQRIERHDAWIAWVCLEREDNDPALLWAAILRALMLSGAWARARDCPLERLVAPTGEPYTAFLAAVVASIERLPSPVVLVLDGTHELHTDEAVHTLNTLLRNSPATLRVVLVARFPPPLILHRLRVEGRLREIGPDDLVFTTDEARLMYAREGVRLSGEELELLMERTEGWAVGLRLAALTLESSGQPAEHVSDFTGDEHVVADYLIGEVVARQPAEVQQFMLSTCICRTFTADLAAELSRQDNAGQILDWLERTGVLISRRRASRRHFRYHPLLRGYLRAELDRRQHSARNQLHRTAAGWHLAAGDRRRAMEHAVDAADDDLVTRLVAKFGLAQVLDGQVQLLRRVLDAAPAHVRARPSVALVAAAAALDVGDVLTADRYLHGIENAQPMRSQRLRALHAAVELNRARLHGDVADAMTALRHTRSGQTGDHDVDLFGLLNRGVAAAWTGHHHAARTNLRHALELATMERRDAAALQCETHLGAIAAVEGDLTTMGERARTAIAIGEKRGWANTSRCAYANALLAVEAYQRLDQARAGQLAASAVELLTGPIDPTIELFTRTVEAMVVFDTAEDPHQIAENLRTHWQRLGNRSVAAPLVAYAAPTYQRMTLRVGEFNWAVEMLQRVEKLLGDGGERALLRAILNAHKGKVTSTRRILLPVLTRDTPTVVVTTVIDAWLLEAHLAQRCDDAYRAHEALSQALTIAAPQHLLRPFWAAGQSIRSLLAKDTGRFGRLEPFASTVLAALPRSVPDPTDGLTEREQALLTELPSMRTTEEIAHTLFVSVNTVKSHLRGIYRKLGVSHRRDAITVARQRGLL